MAEYIDREEYCGKHCRCNNEYCDKESCPIWKAPAADVAPVVHTRWAHLGGDEWCCPVCGFVITTEGSWDKPTKKYCEDCGAKMDGGDNNEKSV
nr:MAG TPA: DNA-directed RNA polymerase [Caudoviricetes sp.]